MVIDNGLGLQSHGSRGGTFAPASNPENIGVSPTARGAIHHLAPPAAPLHGLSKFAYSSFTLQEQSLQVANYSMSVRFCLRPWSPGACAACHVLIWFVPVFAFPHIVQVLHNAEPMAVDHKRRPALHVVGTTWLLLTLSTSFDDEHLALTLVDAVL